MSDTEKNTTTSAVPDREEQHRRDMAIMRSCWEEAEEKVGTYQAALRQIGRILSDLNIPHLTVVDTNDGP